MLPRWGESPVIHGAGAHAKLQFRGCLCSGSNPNASGAGSPHSKRGARAYSYRNAIIGSVLEARLAGSQQAIKATAPSSATTLRKVHGSLLWT